MGPGNEDGFHKALRHSLAITRNELMHEVTTAVNTCVQVYLLDELASQLVEAHELAILNMENENERLRRQVESLDEARKADEARILALQRSPRSNSNQTKAVDNDLSWASDDGCLTSTEPSPRAEWTEANSGHAAASGTSDRVTASMPRSLGHEPVSAETEEFSTKMPCTDHLQNDQKDLRHAESPNASAVVARSTHASNGKPQGAQQRATRMTAESFHPLPVRASAGDVVRSALKDRSKSQIGELSHAMHISFDSTMIGHHHKGSQMEMTKSESRRGSIDYAVDPDSCSARIVRSSFFETFFSIVILLNCASMGVEAHFMVAYTGDQEEAMEKLGIMEVIEHVFTVLFCVELVMRLRVYGWRAFLPTKMKNIWNFLDFFLVVFTGIIFGWIMPLVAFIFNLTTNDGFIRTLTFLRAVRLLRIMRVIQKVQVFREVWLLLKGLTDSMRILVWTCIVIFFVTYMFAVFGLWMISKEIAESYWDPPENERNRELAQILHWVGGLDRILRTLIQFLTLDSWNNKLETMMKYIPWCWLYFYAYIAVAVFVLMNLVTAIIVENAMATSRQDADHQLQLKESALKKELNDMQCLFYMMDVDGNGHLDWDEFEQAFSDDAMLRKWKQMDFSAAECHELFDLLDDGDGGIETDEFFDGLRRMKGTAQSKDIVRVNKKLDRLSNTVWNIAHALGLKQGKKDRESCIMGPLLPGVHGHHHGQEGGGHGFRGTLAAFKHDPPVLESEYSDCSL